MINLKKTNNTINTFIQGIFIALQSEIICEGIISSMKSHDIKSAILYFVIGAISVITINTIWKNLCGTGD